MISASLPTSTLVQLQSQQVQPPSPSQAASFQAALVGVQSAVRTVPTQSSQAAQPVGSASGTPQTPGRNSGTSASPSATQSAGTTTLAQDTANGQGRGQYVNLLA